MPSKTQLGRIERRVEEFYAVCEKITLRTLLFGCSMAEVGSLSLGLFDKGIVPAHVPRER